MRPIEQSCFWLATRPRCVAPVPLAGNCRADVAVVGGGFTGLWTAFFLKQLDPACEVVVLEKGVTGYGGSGRNAGIVSNCIDHSHAAAVSHFGREEAARLARLGIENIDELAAFAVDCDFERTGQLHVALTARQMDDLSRGAEVASRLGIDGYRTLSAAQARAEIDSPLYQGAVFVPGGGIINPAKLVDKLARQIRELGVKLFERTAVSAVERQAVRTPGGTVSAQKVILATDAYSHHLFPQLLARFIPLYDYILVSEPLTEAQLRCVGWRNRQGVLDGRTFFNYYRLTADNRILWGTSEAVYYPPNRVDEGCDHSQAHYDALLASFRRHFPPLAELAFPYAWGGPIASTTRLTPFFGTLSGGSIIYALGYTGHGIGSTRLAGKILAHLALARPSELTGLRLVKEKPFPYPPEPLRWLAVQAVTRSLRRLDRGEKPGLLLAALDALKIGFSS